MSFFRSFRSNALPGVVKNLLIINGLAFLATFLLELQGANLVKMFGIHYFDSPDFRPYQIVTHMFMHGGLTHIFFNMFALWMFGSMLENVWGPKRFLLYYLITGLGAAFLHLAVIHIQVMNLTAQMTAEQISVVVEQGNVILMQGQNYRDAQMASLNLLYNTPTVGASGAVFGLLLAFGMIFPNTPLMLIFVPIPIKAKYFVIIYGLAELIMGLGNFQGDNIAHFAHLGGMLFGFILIKLWNKDRREFY